MAKLFKSKEEMMDRLIEKGYEDDEIAARMQKYVSDGHGFGKQTGASGSLDEEKEWSTSASADQQAWEKRVDANPVMPRLAEAKAGGEGLGSRLWAGAKDIANIPQKASVAVVSGLAGMAGSGDISLDSYIKNRDESFINLQKKRDVAGGQGAMATVSDLATSPDMAASFIPTPAAPAAWAAKGASLVNKVGKLGTLAKAAAPVVKGAYQGAAGSLAGAAISDESKDLGDVATGAGFGIAAGGTLSGLASGVKAGARLGAEKTGKLFGMTSGLNADIIQKAVDDPAYLQTLKEAAAEGDEKAMQVYNEARDVIKTQQQKNVIKSKDLAKGAEENLDSQSQGLASNLRDNLSPTAPGDLTLDRLGERALATKGNIWKTAEKGKEEAFAGMNQYKDELLQPDSKGVAGFDRDNPVPIVISENGLNEIVKGKPLTDVVFAAPELRVVISSDGIYRYKGIDLMPNDVTVYKKIVSHLGEKNTLGGLEYARKIIGEALDPALSDIPGFKPSAALQKWAGDTYHTMRMVQINRLGELGVDTQPLIKKLKDYATAGKFNQETSAFGGNSNTAAGKKLASFSPEEMDNLDELVKANPDQVSNLKDAQQLNFDVLLGKAEEKGIWNAKKLISEWSKNDIRSNATRLYGKENAAKLDDLITGFKNDADKLLQEKEGILKKAEGIEGKLDKELGPLANLPADKYETLFSVKGTEVGNAYAALEGKFAEKVAGVFEPEEIKKYLDKALKAGRELEEAGKAGFRRDDKGKVFIPAFQGSNSSRGQVLSRGTTLVGSAAAAGLIGLGEGYREGSGFSGGGATIGGTLLFSLVSPKVAEKIIRRSYQASKFTPSGTAYNTGKDILKGISRNVAINAGAGASSDD